MNPNINESVRHMNGTMRRKLSLLYEIYSLTGRAYNYVSEDGTEPLNNIIEAKQELILEIDTLDKRFLTDFDALKTELGVSSVAEVRPDNSPEFKELRDNTVEILDILKKLDSMDFKLNQKIKKFREEIATDLTRIRKQRQISGVYSNDPARKQKADASDNAAPSVFNLKK